MKYHDFHKQFEKISFRKQPNKKKCHETTDISAETFAQKVSS